MSSVFMSAEKRIVFAFTENLDPYYFYLWTEETRKYRNTPDQEFAALQMHVFVNILNIDFKGLPLHTVR